MSFSGSRLSPLGGTDRRARACPRRGPLRVTPFAYHFLSVRVLHPPPPSSTSFPGRSALIEAARFCGLPPPDPPLVSLLKAVKSGASALRGTVLSPA